MMESLSGCAAMPSPNKERLTIAFMNEWSNFGISSAAWEVSRGLDSVKPPLMPNIVKLHTRVHDPLVYRKSMPVRYKRLQKRTAWRMGYQNPIQCLISLGG